MEDLIYSFLLQANYPRASIVLDAEMLGISATGGKEAKVPAFVVVDPQTTDTLAVIDVVDAVDVDGLKDAAVETGTYANRLAGKKIQGFVIRVDVRGRTEADQVQFYRVWPNNSLQQVSSKKFPDLDALRVSRMLVTGQSQNAEKLDTRVVSDELDSLIEADSGTTSEVGVGIYIPAVVLLLLIFADGIFSTFRGDPLVSVAQSILALGAAALITGLSVIRADSSLAVTRSPHPLSGR